MAASDTELFFELTDQVFVRSVEQPSQIASPSFFADDVKPLLLKLVRRITTDSVEVVDLTGVTVRIAIGDPAASPTPITSATSGTVDGDGFLPISLPFNVAAVQTALASAASITKTMELRVVTGSAPQRYQTSCTIKQRLITDTLADPVAPLIATSLDEVMALMVPRDGSNPSHPNSAIIFVDEDDPTKVYRFACRSGQFHGELI